jgi:hypothetical protein
MVKFNTRKEMMRELTSHKVNGLNESLRIDVLDGPGAGGACHVYGIASTEPRRSDTPPAVTLPVRFQNGPIAEAGVNGISQEALLAIVEDRLKSFQAGPYACRENAIALTHIQDAMHWLHHRTRERVARGVEGTSAK